MASGRPFPPSAQRLATARASGHLPRVALAPTAAVWSAVVAVAWTFGPRAFESLLALWQSTLESVGRGGLDAAHAELARWLVRASGALSLALFAVAAFTALSLSLARGSFGVARRSSVRFPRVPETRLAAALWVLALALITGLTLADVLTLEPGDLAALARRFAGTTLLFAALSALLDVVLARAAYFGSLWMTRTELHDEQRAAFGAPELRAARSRLRAERDPEPRS